MGKKGGRKANSFYQNEDKYSFHFIFHFNFEPTSISSGMIFVSSNVFGKIIRKSFGGLDFEYKLMSKGKWSKPYIFFSIL